MPPEAGAQLALAVAPASGVRSPGVTAAWLVSPLCPGGNILGISGERVGRAAASRSGKPDAPRKVRAPQGKVVGNADPG